MHVRWQVPPLQLRSQELPFSHDCLQSPPLQLHSHFAPALHTCVQLPPEQVPSHSPPVQVCVQLPLLHSNSLPLPLSAAGKVLKRQLREEVRIREHTRS